MIPYRRYLLALLIGYAASTPAALPGQQASSPATDSAAIHSFWSTLDSTWNARDADRFSLFFTEDASFGFVGRGTSLETRRTIHEHFTRQFGRQAPDLRHVTLIREIRRIAPDVMTVDGKVEVRRHASDAAEPAVLRTLAITAVMVRRDDNWRIRLLRAYQL